MTVSHKSNFRIFDYWEHVDADNVSAPEDKKNFNQEYAFTDGSGNNQAQDMYRIEATVSIGEGNDDQYDLAGVLVDRFGNTLTFATIKQITLINDATASGEDITMGGPAAGTTGSLISDLFDGDVDSRIKVKAGGQFSLVASLTGYTVTGGSADILVITNGGTGDITYRLVVKGTR